MNTKIIACKACGKEIAKSAKACPHCGAKNKKPVFTKLWFWIVVIGMIGVVAGAGNGPENSGEGRAAVNPTVSASASVFDGDCGITASAEIGNNLINFPELEITITNTTEKKISAIKFYAVPYDVYGEEIKGWTTQRELYTDDSIAAGATKKVSFQLIEQSVKTVKLYVYSVYFEDGTQWGDRDSAVSKILGGAPTIEVTVKP